MTPRTKSPRSSTYLTPLLSTPLFPAHWFQLPVQAVLLCHLRLRQPLLSRGTPPSPVLVHSPHRPPLLLQWQHNHGRNPLPRLLQQQWHQHRFKLLLPQHQHSSLPLNRSLRSWLHKLRPLPLNPLLRQLFNLPGLLLLRLLKLHRFKLLLRPLHLTPPAPLPLLYRPGCKVSSN